MATGRLRVGGEAGVGVIELMVVTGLLTIVGSIVLTGVLSAHRVTRHAEERVSAVTTIHQTLATVGREVRAADSHSATVNSALRSAAPESLETDVFRDGTRIRYTYTLAGGSLTERRRVWPESASPGITAPTSDTTGTLIAGLVNAAPEPLFSYRTADGSCITGCRNTLGTYIGTAATASALPEIAEVGLTVRRAVADGPPIEVETRVVLRNA